MAAPSTLPFRETLFRWFLAVIALIAFPWLALEVRSPFEELSHRVEVAQALISGVSAGVSAEDLSVLNQTALALAQAPGDEQADEARAVAFAMLVQDGTLANEDAIRARYGARKAEPPPTAEIARQYAAWQAYFDGLPDGAQRLATFRRVRTTLAAAMLNAAREGMDVADIYLAADPGPQAGGLFTDSLVFVLGARDWGDLNIFPGQAFNLVEDDGMFWRASYLPALGGQPNSFGHNPMHDPLLPRFESDEWGDWFSAWYARSTPQGVTDSFTVDFEASAVRHLMIEVAVAATGATLILLMVVVFIVRRLANWVGRPVSALRRGAEAVIAGNYDHVIPDKYATGEFEPLVAVFNQMIAGLRERVNLLATLEKLLSKELAQAAARRGLALGGRMADVTVLFTDFAGFSTLTQGLPAPEVVLALNDYFIELIAIIKRHGGFPDKYIGDGILAVFGAPVALDDHASRAVRCAIEMQRRMREINAERRARGQLVFEMRVGINTGEVMVGAIGCDEKLEYTSIGETTNLASRMEAHSPIGHIALAEACHQRLNAEDLRDVVVRPAGRLEVKGFPEPVAIWHVLVDGLVVEKRPLSEVPGSYVYRDIPPATPPE